VDVISDVRAGVHDAAATSILDLKFGGEMVKDSLVDLVKLFKLLLHFLGNGLFQIAKLTRVQ
jgi:hypothetical protein